MFNLLSCFTKLVVIGLLRYKAAYCVFCYRRFFPLKSKARHKNIVQIERVIKMSVGMTCVRDFFFYYGKNLINRFVSSRYIYTTSCVFVTIFDIIFRPYDPYSFY